MSERPVLSTTLDRLRAASILQLAESESCTGFIRVGDRGRIDLQRGQVVGAQARPDLEGRAAVLELLTVTSGPIELVEHDVVSGVPLARTVNLIMDGARLADEWAELGADVWRYRDDVGASVRDARLVQVLVEMARGRTLDDATAALGLARATIHGLMRRAVEDGALVRCEPGSAPPVDLVPSTRSAPRRVPEIIELIERLATNTPDVEASAVVDTDGLMIASALAANVDDDAVAAMSAALLGMAERIVDQLGRGAFEMVMTRGGDGYIVLMPCGRDAVLSVLTSSSARVGLIFLDLRRAATEVAKLLA